jgi:hypothetical protein
MKRIVLIIRRRISINKDGVANGKVTDQL